MALGVGVVGVGLGSGSVSVSSSVSSSGSSDDQTHLDHAQFGIFSYRIRLPTEKEQEMVVSKVVKKMRYYESTLLSTYKVPPSQPYYCSSMDAIADPFLVSAPVTTSGDDIGSTSHTEAGMLEVDELNVTGELCKSWKNRFISCLPQIHCRLSSVVVRPPSSSFVHRLLVLRPRLRHRLLLQEAIDRR
ncbi:hypothetical protein LOK49_Contig94G00003 [Camellia lanceoleosa]|nr:hypothetical protein LOK49_Contig94G00003 [Camellia lanceoleosa]